jgi:hypothetical protein
VLTSDEWRLLDPAIDEVLRTVEPAVSESAVKQLREWFAMGEQGFVMDLLVWLMLSLRVPLDPRTYDLVSHVVMELGPLPGRVLPCLSDPAGVIALLDREGEPLRRRVLLPQRGGHTAAVGRGAIAFPPGWTEQRIRRAADPVLATATVAQLPNGRRWRTARVEGVAVGVLATSADEVRAVVPVAPPGTRPGVRHFIDPDRPTLAELLARTVRNSTEQVRLSLVATDEEGEVLRQLHLAAEYDELADALIARADQDWLHLDPDARRRARALLRTFDLPVEGCTHLNDRDATLERWGA